MHNHSPEAEQSVIGSCLQSEWAFDAVADKLAPSDFALADHVLIYQAIESLRNSGKGVDAVTVNHALQALDARHSRSFETGDDSLGYLLDLVEATPSAANVRTYAEVVKNHSVSRKLKAAAQQIESIADDGKTASEKTADAAALIDAVASERSDDNAKTAREIMLDVTNSMMEQMETAGSLAGLATGFEHLDEMTSGLQKSDLFILAGRPSQGKSTLAINIAEHVAKTEPVLVFSLEMSSEALGKRMLASIGGIEFNHIRSAVLSDEEQACLVQAAQKIQTMQIVIDDSAGISVDQLRARARILARKHGCKLIVVDYLQMLSGKGENKTTETGYISRGLKGLAKELDVPVLALSQLNRGLSDRKEKRPVMSDLRGSGDIEQDADVIAFIHLEQKYDEDTHLKGLGELIIAKQRQGETGTIFLKEQLHQMRYASNFDAIPSAPAAPARGRSNVSAFGFGD